MVFELAAEKLLDHKVTGCGHIKKSTRDVVAPRLLYLCV